LFTLEPASGTAVQLAGIVDMTTLNITGGEKDGEGIAMGSGGRAWKQGFQGDYTIEFDSYTVGVHATGGNSMFSIAQFFDGQALDTTEPIKTGNGDFTTSKNMMSKYIRYRITFLQTEKTAAASAVEAIASPLWAYRLSFANARITKYNYSFADGVWKISVALKVPAFKKDATSNRQEESSDGSDAGGLSALGAYTNANNW